MSKKRFSRCPLFMALGVKKTRLSRWGSQLNPSLEVDALVRVMNVSELAQPQVNEVCAAVFQCHRRQPVGVAVATFSAFPAYLVMVNFSPGLQTYNANPGLFAGIFNWSHLDHLFE